MEECQRFFASLGMTIAGGVSQDRQPQLLKSSGQTSLRFLMRVVYGLVIALLTAFVGCEFVAWYRVLAIDD
jgi:hypothetical protein